MGARSCWRTRIIPTRMGTRKELVKDEELIRDHPHAYGDKIPAVLYAFAA